MPDDGTKDNIVQQPTAEDLYLEALKTREQEREANGGDTTKGVKAVQDAYAQLLISGKERVN